MRLLMIYNLSGLFAALEIWGWCDEVYGVCTVHILTSVHTVRTVHTVPIVHTVRNMHTTYTVQNAHTVRTLYAVRTVYTAHIVRTYILFILYVHIMCIICILYVKVRGVPLQVRCGPECSKRLRLTDFMTFGTWRWWDCQPHAPARKCSWYSFSLGAESTPVPWNGQKEYFTEKSSDTNGIFFKASLLVQLSYMKCVKNALTKCS